MAATFDSALCANLELKSAIARGMNFGIGRFTGTYGGIYTTTTIVGMNNLAFVYIPPVSNYMFQYSISSTAFAMVVQGAAASNSVLASYDVSVDLSSFSCMFNGEATVGVPFCAIGF